MSPPCDDSVFNGLTGSYEQFTVIVPSTYNLAVNEYKFDNKKNHDFKLCKH